MHKILSVTHKTLLFCLFFCFNSHHLVWGQSIAWEVTGQTNYGISPLAPIISNPNLTVAGLTRGAGVSTSGTAAGDAWGGNGFDAIDQNAAITNQDFVTFTVSPNTGFTLNLISVSTYNIRRSGTGPTTGIWQYSLDGTNFTNIGTPITWGGNTTAAGNAQAAIDLSGITELQAVDETTTVTFRIVNWGASDAGGTWYINNQIGNDLEINGAVVPVGGTPSNTTDAFRSRQSGNWNSPDTWESFTGGAWIPATLIPNSTAGVITILPTHIVNVTADVTIDQTVIAPGGVLNYTEGTISLNDGAEDDLIIQGDEGTGVGGVFNHNGGDAMNVPVGATVSVQTAGVLRVTSNTGGIGDAYAGNASTGKFIYADAAVFNWNTINTFTSDNQIYFPNAGASTPIFLITANVGSIGANNPTTFNGLLVLDGGSISFQNAGLKTFRNGITGLGTVTRINGSGAFQIGSLTQTSTLGASIDLNNMPMTADANDILIQIGATVLSNDLTLSNGTLVVGGGIDLNGRNINLGTTGHIQEDRANSRIITDLTATTEASPGGYIEATNRNVTVETDVAGLGFIVDNANITLLRRSHYRGDGGKGIRRIFRAEGTPNNSLLGIEYAASDLDGIAENDLAMFRWDATNGWEDYPTGLSLDAVNNRVSVTGVNTFSTWTLGDTNDPLPIRLGPFTATLTPENHVLLQWRTYTEENNRGFWVEKSLDGLAFAPLGFVEGAGNSNQPLDYQFVDTALRQASYYRLKQTDEDGSMHVSPVVFVNPSLAMRLQIWPNPAQNRVQVQAWGFDQSPVSAELYDARGKLLDSHYGNIDQVVQSLNRRLPHLASGLYLLSVRHPQGVFTERIVKE